MNQKLFFDDLSISFNILKKVYMFINYIICTYILNYINYLWILPYTQMICISNKL